MSFETTVPREDLGRVHSVHCSGDQGDLLIVNTHLDPSYDIIKTTRLIDTIDAHLKTLNFYFGNFDTFLIDTPYLQLD